MESTPSGRRTSSSRRSTACKSRHSTHTHTHQRACRECNSSARQAPPSFFSCSPPPPEIPPPFFSHSHMLFSPLRDSCTIFFLPVIERGDGGGVSPAQQKRTTQTNTFFFTQTQKKNNVRRSK